MQTYEIGIDQVPGVPGGGLNDGYFDNLWEDVQDIGGDIIGKAKDAGVKRVTEEVTDFIGGETPEDNAIVKTPAPVVPSGPQITPPPPTPPPAGTPAEKTVESDSVMSKVKQIPPWAFGGLLGGLTYAFSESWIGAALAGAGSYLLTSKYVK